MDANGIRPRGPAAAGAYPAWVWALPILVAAVLVLPGLRLGYVWDDYHFLANAQTYRSTDLLPDPEDFFYRPISRGVYFILLHTLGHGAATAGHILNFLILSAGIVLLMDVGSRLGGRRVGLLSGFAFAALSSVPLLVDWASGVQDLLAVLFLLAAIRLRLKGRNHAALWMAVCGILSKETVMVAVPVLVALDWILERRPYRIGRETLRYTPVILAWMAVHPGIHKLIGVGFQSGATGYVGMEHPGRWPLTFARYLLTLVNVPVTGLATQWPAGLTPVMLIGGAILLWGLFLVARTAAAEAAVPPGIPPGRAALLAALLTALPVALTTTFIRNFTPYYASVGGVGSSLLLGFLLARARPTWAAAGLATYLVLGVWSRGVTLEPTISTEVNIARAARAIRRVEEGFRRLRPGMPPHAQLLVSVEARGNEGVYTHMYQFQAPRVWYDDPTLRIAKPEARRSDGAPELLFAVTPDLDVLEIDRGTLEVRSSGREPDYAYVEGAVRAYATGLACSGETDAAAAVLLRMPEISPRLHSVHVRLAAMYLRAAGRTDEAKSTLRFAPSIDRSYALTSLRAVIAGQPPGRVFDDAALWAFGIPLNDREAARDLMRWFYSMRYTQPAIRFARRVGEGGAPDSETANVISQMTALYEEQSRVPEGP